MFWNILYKMVTASDSCNEVSQTDPNPNPNPDPNPYPNPNPNPNQVGSPSTPPTRPACPRHSASGGRSLLTLTLTPPIALTLAPTLTLALALAPTLALTLTLTQP